MYAEWRPLDGVFPHRRHRSRNQEPDPEGAPPTITPVTDLWSLRFPSLSFGLCREALLPVSTQQGPIALQVTYSLWFSLNRKITLST